MSFTPTFCPREPCSAHTAAPADFRFQAAGTYTRKCDGRTVERFRCLKCHQSFSEQTFRVDYRLKRPELLVPILLDLVSKVTQRQSARTLVCHRTTVVRHFGRIADHGARFQRVRLAEKRAAGGIAGESYQLDELETYEQHRKLKPVTVPVLIERDSGFVVAHAAEALASRKPGNPREEQQLERIRAREGTRVSGSTKGVTRCFELLRRVDERKQGILIETDRKTSYETIVSKCFGESADHARHSSKLPRTTQNPLWPINHTFARLRDGISRLVRETWAAAKLRSRLSWHMAVWTLWRNFVRGRTNRDRHVTPAMKLGVEAQQWTPETILVDQVWPKRAPAM